MPSYTMSRPSLQEATCSPVLVSARANHCVRILERWPDCLGQQICLPVYPCVTLRCAYMLMYLPMPAMHYAILVSGYVCVSDAGELKTAQWRWGVQFCKVPKGLIHFLLPLPAFKQKALWHADRSRHVRTAEHSFSISCLGREISRSEAGSFGKF